MSKQLGPVEVCCESPSYEIVRACRTLGIRSPEDVRWLRLSTFCSRPPARPPVSFWRRLFGAARPADRDACTCGRKLPALHAVAVVFTDGIEAAYLLGQCDRCRTVFWDVP